MCARVQKYGSRKKLWVCASLIEFSSPLLGTLNTNVITGLDMCEVCTEAVHREAL